VKVRVRVGARVRVRVRVRVTGGPACAPSWRRHPLWTSCALPRHSYRAPSRRAARACLVGARLRVRVGAARACLVGARLRVRVGAARACLVGARLRVRVGAARVRARVVGFALLGFESGLRG
jgi:hypothetical protein